MLWPARWKHQLLACSSAAAVPSFSQGRQLVSPASTGLRERRLNITRQNLRPSVTARMNRQGQERVDPTAFLLGCSGGCHQHQDDFFWWCIRCFEPQRQFLPPPCGGSREDVLQGPRERSCLLPLCPCAVGNCLAHFSWGRGGGERARLVAARIGFRPPLLSSSILAAGRQRK